MTMYNLSYEQGFEIDVKRFQLPENIVEILKPTCTICGVQELIHNGDYLSYPIIGKETSTSFYCEHCDEYSSIPIKIEGLTLSVTIKETEIELDLGDGPQTFIKTIKGNTVILREKSDDSKSILTTEELLNLYKDNPPPAHYIDSSAFLFIREEKVEFTKENITCKYNIWEAGNIDHGQPNHTGIVMLTKTKGWDFENRNIL